MSTEKTKSAINNQDVIKKNECLHSVTILFCHKNFHSIFIVKFPFPLNASIVTNQEKNR